MVDFADHVVLGIREVDVAARVHGDAGRLVQESPGADEGTDRRSRHRDQAALQEFDLQPLLMIYCSSSPAARASARSRQRASYSIKPL
jgi:hypothetical protein